MKGTRCFVVVAALSALLLLASVSQSKAAEVTGEEERSCNASTTWDVAAGRELLEDAGAWVLERSLTEMLLMAIMLLNASCLTILSKLSAFHPHTI